MEFSFKRSEKKERDSIGRFVRGCTPINPRDKKTGRFLSGVKAKDEQVSSFSFVRSKRD